jgi:hypothetical protein
MKKLVNTPLSNTIWWATINEKNGTMNTSTRVDVTNNALQSVLDHIIMMDMFKDEGFAGYTYSRKDNSGNLTLCAIDENKMKVISIEDYNKFKEIKNNDI